MEIKYETSLVDASKCITPCPFGLVDIAYNVEPVKVGSGRCMMCNHHGSRDYTHKKVTCNYGEESKQ